MAPGDAGATWQETVTESPISWDVPTFWLRQGPGNGYGNLQQALPQFLKEDRFVSQDKHVLRPRHSSRTFRCKQSPTRRSPSEGTCISRDCVPNYPCAAAFSFKRNSWRRISRSTQHFGSFREGLLPPFQTYGRSSIWQLCRPEHPEEVILRL